MRNFLFFALFLFSFCTVFSQDSSFLFVKTNDEIGRRAITCMSKDANDYLWIGTYGGGLKKFDGIQVQTYQHTIDLDSALSSSVINDIHLDANANLWIGTDKGLHLYDSNNDTFSRHFQKNTAIHAIGTLDQNRIILGTHQKGVYIYDTKTQEVQKIALPSTIEENGLQVNDIAVDRSGRTWLATNLGLFQLDLHQLKINFLQLRNEHDQALLSNSILSLTTDSLNNLWLGTMNKGLLKIAPYNSNDLKIEHFPFTDKRIFSVVEYQSGTLLCGTENDGLFVLNSKGDIQKKYTKQDENLFGVQSNSIWSIYCDDENRIFIGYYDKGVYKYDPLHFKFSFLQNNIGSDLRPFPSSISSIFKDAKENIWFSSIDGGVYFYDTSREVFTHFNDPNNKIASGLNSLDIPSIFIDSKENVWVASWYNGIYLLKKGSKRFINYNTKTNPESILSNRVVSFAEDSKGIIWIGTFSGGLISYDPSTRDFMHYNSDAFVQLELDNSNIRKVIVDSQDNIWLGTRKGLFRYSPKTGRLVSMNAEIGKVSGGRISEFIVFSLYEDLNKNIWIGTDGYGVFSYTNVEDKFTWHMNNSDMRNISINSITQTYDGMYWLGSDRGLIQYNAATDASKTFSTPDGLLSNNVNRNAFFQDSETLYVGTSEGICFFDFDDMLTNENPPKIKLTNLKISNIDVPIHPEGALTKALHLMDTLRLNHNQSSFAIDYTGINYTRGANNSYAYTLEGLEDNWNYVNDLRTATYTNIRPGQYVFKLKAANNDGVWSATSKDLFVKVLPPWWNTIAARLGYVLFAFLLVFYIYRILRLKGIEKQKVVLERNQRKQTEELHNKKIQFFTNISHEFRTPLTLILNPLESLVSSSMRLNLPKEVRDKHKTIHRNTKRMKRLIDELMDFRKMQFSKIQVRAKNVNIRNEIEEVLLNFKEESIDRKINLHSDFDKLFDHNVWVDSSMFEKIIYNLLSNAFKATKDGGSIRIQAVNHNAGVIFPLIDPEKPIPALEVVVQDSGFGVKKENIKKIFERFYQDKQNNEQYYGGTGIGLEVVSAFIEYHKGKIEVESAENIGTSFKIYFPLGNTHFEPNQLVNNEVMFEQTQDEEEVLALSEDSQEHADQREYSVLIVEDNMELREYLKSELSVTYKIHEAGNGRVGYDMAKALRPDAIISDVMMPELNGFEMCELLKKDKETSVIPILMLTAKVSEKDRIQGIDAGADVYLKKPFSLNLLKSHLKQMILSKNQFYNSYFDSLDLKIDTESNDKKTLADVVTVIGNNLSKEDLSVQNIADELHLSRSKLYRLIKNMTAMSTNELIRKIRLEKSKELLESSDMSIGEICYRVGFASPSYFTKRFKTYTGLIPKQFRINHQLNNE